MKGGGSLWVRQPAEVLDSDRQTPVEPAVEPTATSAPQGRPHTQQTVLIVTSYSARTLLTHYYIYFHGLPGSGLR